MMQYQTGTSLLEDTVGNPRTEFPRSELLHFLQDAEDFAPIRGRFPGVRRVAGTPRPKAFRGGGSHGRATRLALSQALRRLSRRTSGILTLGFHADRQGPPARGAGRTD